MESFKIWVTAGWIHFIIGFAVGWLVLKQPQWAKSLVYRLWDWIKSKVFRIAPPAAPPPPPKTLV